MRKTTRLLFVAALVEALCVQAAPKPIPARDFDKMNLRSPSESSWTALSITAPPGRRAAAPDFFTTEFGRPLIFESDWIKDEGYCDGGTYALKDGKLVFTTGDDGFAFGFGPRLKTRERDSLCLGLGWGKCCHATAQIEMTLSQDTDSSAWEINAYSQNYDVASSKLTVKGKGEQTVTTSLGPVRNLFLNAPMGIRFSCATPGVTVAVKSIKIVPYVGTAYFRKTFALSEKPLFAQASFNPTSVYQLYVNGKLVQEGNRIDRLGPVAHLDLTSYLRQGENTIAFSRENDTYGADLNFALEGMAFGRDGKVMHFITDGAWKGNKDEAAGWFEPGFDDSRWPAVKASKGVGMAGTGDGQQFFKGINPRHMGLLQPQPENKKYPLFDYDKDINYTLRLPAGLDKELRPSVEVRNYPARKLLETVQPAAVKESGDWKEYAFHIPQRQVGAYKLHWKLAKAGKTLEENHTDLVVVGPIDQQACAPDEIDKKFEDDLELVYAIDCTEPMQCSPDFIDHTGYYVSEQKLNSGRITTKDGMTYRESGEQIWDHFGYRLNLFDYRGQPLVVEVSIPDNEVRDVVAMIYEAYPAAFINNSPKGGGAHGVASAAMRTGTDTPLSFKERKLRFLYWPGSAVASINIGTWFPKRAAASRINFYKLKSGKLPYVEGGSQRLIGPHAERITNIADTAMRTFDLMMADRSIFVNGAKDAYCLLYQMYAEKIRFLRFTGQNFTVEGVYMYNGGAYPSLKHSSCNNSNQDVDPLLLALKLYNHNGIKCDLGVEYMASPMEAAALEHPSDRKLRRGEGEATHMLDRYGRQVFGQGGGVNFMHPGERAVMLDAIKEIGGFYAKEPAVDALFLVVGSWWTPGFIIGTRKDIRNTEVGYDDITVGRFEKEASVDLGIAPKDTERFEKRYQRLMSVHKEQWLHWRAEKVKECVGQIRDSVKPLPVDVLLTEGLEKDSPFTRSASTLREREDYAYQRASESGFIPELYPVEDKINIVGNCQFFPGSFNPDGPWRHVYGWNYSKSMRDLIDKYGAVYTLGWSLEELTFPTQLHKGWMWSSVASSNTYTRRPNEHAMADFADFLEKSNPRKFYTTWTDCNFDTNIDSAIREFCLGFRAIPNLPFAPCRTFKGGAPMLAADKGLTYLRLVNNTPYPAQGTLQAKAAKARDLVNGTELNPDGFRFQMQPNAVAVFSFEELEGDITGQLAHAPATAALAKQEAEGILADKAIPGENRKNLLAALFAHDYFTVFTELKSYELANVLDNVKKSVGSRNNQALFLEDLEKSRGRINCAYDKIVVAPDGARWLPDQPYHNKTAYGNENATWVDRGADLKIEGSPLQRVYSTEAYGMVVRYYIPVPDGEYNVYLHFAETYNQIKEPGKRRITVEVQSVKHPEEIDPFAKAGGFAKPYVLKIEEVKVNDGLLAIRLIRDVGIQGIEVEKYR